MDNEGIGKICIFARNKPITMSIKVFFEVSVVNQIFV